MLGRWALLIGMVWGACAEGAEVPRTLPSWLDVEVGAGTGWDSNVYATDHGLHARRSSTVQQGRLQISTHGETESAGTWSSAFTVEPSWYWDEPEEDHVRSTLRLKTSGGEGGWTWAFEGTGRWVEGSSEPIVWEAPGGAPALGGYEIRDRRDQLTWSHLASLARREGPWLGRVLARGYWHDFQTRERAAAGCQNYVDRSEWLFGADAGGAVREGWDLGLGLRAGVQEQARLLDSPIAYSSTFWRPVAFTGGSPAPGWTLEAEAGPDFRRFDGPLAPGDAGQRTEFVYQVKAAWSPGPQDTFSLQARQLPVPSSGGRGMFRDGLWAADWQHRWGGGWSTLLGFQAQENDFYPAPRRDRVYTPRLEAGWNGGKGWSLKISGEFSTAESEVPHTEAREFERQRVMVSAACAF